MQSAYRYETSSEGQGPRRAVQQMMMMMMMMMIMQSAYRVHLYSIWFSQQIPITSLNIVNQLVFTIHTHPSVWGTN